jgi:hypothetical protein
LRELEAGSQPTAASKARDVVKPFAMTTIPGDGGRHNLTVSMARVVL